MQVVPYYIQLLWCSNYGCIEFWLQLWPKSGCFSTSGKKSGSGRIFAGAEFVARFGKLRHTYFKQQTS